VKLVNKRARTRLIGVTAIILIAIAAIILGAGSKQGAYYKTVKDVTSDEKLVGERVRVGGAVVAGSWDKKSNPMRFAIREEGDESASGPTIKVVYNGTVPSTFGDGVVAIVTGELSQDGTIDSNDMITKCPSKYQSATGALTVESLTGGDDLAGKSIKVTGYVTGEILPPGGDVRFVIANTADSGDKTLSVFYDGAIPQGMEAGSQVVLGGSLDENGTFDAVSVAISESEKS
jgi:cytochrome c-type biogenesis protein CcmE